MILKKHRELIALPITSTDRVSLAFAMTSIMYYSVQY